LNNSYPDIDSVKKCVREFVLKQDIEDVFDFLIGHLPDEAEIFIVGGAIRNLIIKKVHGWSPVTADIDLFIGNIDRARVLDFNFNLIYDKLITVYRILLFCEKLRFFCPKEPFVILNGPLILIYLYH